MTTYTFTRGRTEHEHGSAAANNTPALRGFVEVLRPSA